jgi:hypothetical protein
VPGSKKAIAEWTDKTHLKLGPHIYDCGAIAKSYSLDFDAMCWPVLLSVKPGDAALTLCPCFGTDGHTSIKSAAHVRPKKWNLNTIEKSFAKKTAAAGDKRKQTA